VQILKPPAMVNPGVYPKPIPRGGMGKPVNQKRILRPFPNHDDGHRGPTRHEKTPHDYVYGSEWLCADDGKAGCCRRTRHRGIGLPLTTGKAEAGTLPSVVEGL
jgi:hypothetical protein